MSDILRDQNRSIHTANIVRAMFVGTADQNYIMCRKAFSCGFEVDFWWSALHAIEKYMKAVLLLNDKSVKNFSHNVSRLYKAICSIDKRIIIEPFCKPKNYEHAWPVDSVEDFLLRLDRFGAADNRYLTYGYNFGPYDLVKVDHVIWSIRRLCRPLVGEIRTHSGPIAFDHLKEIINSPLSWKLDVEDLLLEKLIDFDQYDQNRSDFLRSNFSFGSNDNYKPVALRLSTHLSYPPIFYVAISMPYGATDKMLEGVGGINLNRLCPARLEYPAVSGDL